MTRSILLSIIFHSVMVVITALSLPFMTRAPIDLPPILSVELIQITDKTNIPFAAKAAKTLEKIKKKEEEKRVVSEQAPPAEKKKEKPDRIPLPEDLNKETSIKAESLIPEDDVIYVMKLNHIIRFNTGIYDYSVMSSVFSDVVGTYWPFALRKSQ